MKPLSLRILLWFFSHVPYRVKVLNSDRLPRSGGALLVSNHVSFVDLLLILSSTERFVRFLLPAAICERPLLKPWLRLLRVIPLPGEDPPELLEAALRAASRAILSGEVVGLFAERSITRIGILLPFRRELERIMSGLSAPIVPVCLDGVCGSSFSYRAGGHMFLLPRRIPYPVAVNFGSPMPATSTAAQVRTAVQLLGTEAWPSRMRTMRTLGRGFVLCARKHPFRFAMADARVPKLSFGGALVKTIFLARRLKQHWTESGQPPGTASSGVQESGRKMVGVFLPPSVGGALVNLAILLAGRVPVNLNYTASAETLESCARQCGLEKIITSRAFLDRVKTPLPCPVVLLEEAAAKPRGSEKLAALALAWLAPLRLLERALGCDATPGLHDLAVVVFSSGSTAEPKGVMLSHYNLNSNVLQLCQVFDYGPQDRFLGILPFFHSFGLTATLLTPALEGIGVVYHPNPLEPKPIGELVQRHAITYLMVTPVFLQLYLRSCEPEQFKSLRFVMTGAEKLQERLAAAFHQKFGIRPVEGYGCTECSPVVAANAHDFHSGAIGQVGSRPGTIGHPLPGVSVRIIDPDTGVEVPLGQAGLLLVRGPNVMMGYLNRPEKTAEILRDGWYHTGDIARINEDGFVQITDRISRFSKIAGEMVPHAVVEEKLHELAASSELTFAVTGIPDEQKGERLVVLHRLPEPVLENVLARLPELQLPNLWVPKRNQFVSVDQIPTLGSGKLDLRSIREIAKRSAAARAAVLGGK